MKPWRTFTVATGQAIYPTPLGKLRHRRQVEGPVVVSARLAVGEGREADPAGPGQPARHALDGLLRAGRRHPRHARSGSLGYSASHGCIRMYIPYAEWLFDHVDVGTPVYIVPA